MDFFQNQETARRKTGLLIVYFIAAVVLIVLLSYAIVAGAFLLTGRHDRPPLHSVVDLWDPGLFALVSLGTLALIGGGSLYRVASLAGGGHSVAEMMGGRPLSSQTTDPDERKILNVVEEMAIAAGTPVPPVYLLEQEDGINAFAAGYAPGDAVIGVTRGCIQNLTRDELQGVIAHEFSHILNGDMRLNIRLIGALYGILLISMTGWIIFRSTAYGNSYDNRRDGDRRGSNPWPMVGLALYVLGYIGVFFGNLIKAAVSRQREFLADASAVQFTRNPDGIAGALKKIGALAEGSRVRAPEAQEASHLFFGDAVGHLLGMFATHPPLVERIRRIDPSFEGDFSKVRVGIADGPRPEAGLPTTLRPPVRTGRGVVGFSPAQMVNRIGTVEPQQLAYASSVLSSLPDSLRALAYEPFGARAIVFALLVDNESEAVQATQLDRLAAHAEPELVRVVEKILPTGAQPDARAAPAPGLDDRPDPEAALSRSVPDVCGRRPRADPGGQPGEPLRIRLAPADPPPPGPSLRIRPDAAEPRQVGGPPRRTCAARPGGPRPHRQRAAFGCGPCLCPGGPGPGLARNGFLAAAAQPGPRGTRSRLERARRRRAASSSGKSSTPARPVSVRMAGSPSRKASCSVRSPMRWDVPSRRSSRSRVARRSPPIPWPDGIEPIA